MSISEDRDELVVARWNAAAVEDPAAALVEMRQRNADMIATAERFREAQKAAEAKPGEMLRTSVAGTASVTVKDGVATVTTGGQASAQAHTPLPEGMVRLPNGMTTTVEAARAAGFDMPSASFSGGTTDAPQTAPNDTTGHTAKRPDDAANVSPNAAPVEGMTELEAAKTELAHAHLAVLSEVAGAATVQAAQEDIAVSGELPSTLPEGVRQDQVDAVVAGYVAQADAVLRPTGASVATLMEFLDEGELRAARVAAFRGDDTTLRELGAKAMERLAHLPKDPARLAALTADWPKDVQVTRRGNTVWVGCPEWPHEIKWGDAVRAGKIKL